MDIVFLSGYKDSCIDILNKKVNNLTEEGILDGLYEYTSDRTHEDLENYPSFVHRHCNFYKDIWTYKN